MRKSRGLRQIRRITAAFLSLVIFAALTGENVYAQSPADQSGENVYAQSPADLYGENEDDGSVVNEAGESDNGDTTATVSECDISTAPISDKEEELSEEDGIISDNGKSMEVNVNATIDSIPDSVQAILIRSGKTLTVNGDVTLKDKYLEIEEGGILNVKGNMSVYGDRVPGSYNAGMYGQEQIKAWQELPSWGRDQYGVFTRGREGKRVKINIDGNLSVGDHYNGINGANTDLYVGGNVICTDDAFITIGHYQDGDQGSTMTVKGSVLWNVSKSPSRLYVNGEDSRCMTVYGDIIDSTYRTEEEHGELIFDNLYLPTPGSMCINGYARYTLELEGPLSMYAIYPDHIYKYVDNPVIEKQAAFDPDIGIKMFVIRMYAEVLDRMPDKAGLDDWTGSLKNKTKNGADIAQGFIMSDEFLLNSDLTADEYVRLLYKVFFDREPSDDEVAGWKRQMMLEDKSRKYVLAGFVNSAEFENLCKRYGIESGHMEASLPVQIEVSKMKVDASGVDRSAIEDYVDRFYLQLLGRPAEWEGKNYWVNNILSGEQYDAASAIKVGIIESTEFRNRDISDQEFLRCAYYGFFDREPDDAGYLYWLRNLAEGSYTKSSVIEVGFGRSEEFSNLLKRVGFIIK